MLYSDANRRSLPFSRFVLRLCERWNERFHFNPGADRYDAYAANSMRMPSKRGVCDCIASVGAGLV